MGSVPKTKLADRRFLRAARARATSSPATQKKQKSQRSFDKLRMTIF
jgi:hypothetical protein